MNTRLFLTGKFIESYVNHKNKLVNYVISTIVNEPLPCFDQLIITISPEIADLRLKEVVKPVSRSVSLSKVKPLIWLDSDRKK